MPGGPGSGRKPKPTAVHIAQGTYQPCRHAKRLDAQHRVGGWPCKPGWLEPPESEVWDDIVSAIPDAAIGKVDTHQLVDLMRERMIYRQLTDRVLAGEYDKDLMTWRKNARDAVMKLSDAFGCNPRARAGMKLEKDAKTGGTLATLLRLRESDDGEVSRSG